MTDQFAIPPAHIWSKIEQRLDEQDNRIRFSDKLIASAFSNSKLVKKLKLYAAAMAGASLIAGFFWLKM